MGNCSCFSGLQGKRVSSGAPDICPPRSADQRRFVVTDAQGKSTVARNRAGSWTTPHGQAWASPLPRKQEEQSAQNDDFDIVLSSKEEGAVQLDVDARRGPDVFARQLSEESRSKFEIEQLVAFPGMLPKAMSAHEREQMLRMLLPTATFEMLSKVDPQLVQAEGPEGQKLRRKLAEGATVVFFTAGYAGKRFVFERARDLGIKAVIIEHPDSWSRSLVDEGVIAKFVPVDMAQASDKIFEQTLQLIKDLGQDGVTGEADAICTFVELSVPLVARLCERLGLPTASSSAVDQARDKHATRAALKRAGLPTPKNCLIHSEADIEQAANLVGFPAVLKPISGAASLGVKKVCTRDQLLPAYREVADELNSLVVVSGALEKADGSGKGVSADAAIALTVLFEQYLDGTEVDVDVIMSEGQWRYASITDNGPTLEPYFNETWGVCPSLLPLSQQRELKDLAVNSLTALGFTAGVFHVECKYTSSGPQLIEINARMGGGPVREISLRTWGVDLVEEALFVALGIPSRPAVPRVPLVSSAYYVVPATVSGKLLKLPDLERMRQVKDVIWARPLVALGDRIVGPAEGLPTWVLDIFVEKPDAKEALDFVMKLEEENRVVIG